MEDQIILKRHNPGYLHIQFSRWLLTSAQHHGSVIFKIILSIRTCVMVVRLLEEEKMLLSSTDRKYRLAIQVCKWKAHLDISTQHYLLSLCTRRQNSRSYKR